MNLKLGDTFSTIELSNGTGDYEDDTTEVHTNCRITKVQDIDGSPWVEFVSDQTKGGVPVGFWGDQQQGSEDGSFIWVRK